MVFILVDATAGHVRHLRALQPTQQSGYERAKRGEAWLYHEVKGVGSGLRKIVFYRLRQLHDMDTLDSGRRWTGGACAQSAKGGHPFGGPRIFHLFILHPLSLHSNCLLLCSSTYILKSRLRRKRFLQASRPLGDYTHILFLSLCTSFMVLCFAGGPFLQRRRVRERKQHLVIAQHFTPACSLLW